MGRSSAIKPDRAPLLALGILLDDAVAAYRRALWRLLLISALVQVPLFLAQATVLAQPGGTGAALDLRTLATAAGPASGATEALYFSPPSMLLAWHLALATVQHLVVLALSLGALVFCASEISAGRLPSVAASYRVAFQRAPSLLLALMPQTLLAGAAALLAIVLPNDRWVMYLLEHPREFTATMLQLVQFAVPAAMLLGVLVLAALLLPVAPAVVLGRMSALHALQACWPLARHDLPTTIGAQVVLALVGYLLAGLPGTLLEITLILVGSGQLYTISPLLVLAVGRLGIWLWLPMVALVATQLYQTALNRSQQP